MKNYMCALNFAIGPSYEVVIAGQSDAEGTKTMLKALRTQFVPNKIVLLNPIDEDSPEIHRLAEFTKDQSSIEGQATAYVCLNHNCKLPTIETSQMLDILSN